MTDTQGNILVALVHAADIQDRDGARPVLEALVEKHPTVQHVWADGGYAGELTTWADEHGLDLEIVRRSDKAGFHVLPRRWVVERTFGWLGFFRRLSKEYEELLAISKSVLYSAMTQRMLKRLTE